MKGYGKGRAKATENGRINGKSEYMLIPGCIV